MIRCPQSKLELVWGLPLPQGQKFTVRKTTGLHEEDYGPSSNDHQEETPLLMMHEREGGTVRSGVLRNVMNMYTNSGKIVDY